jgi:hypothetical protein
MAELFTLILSARISGFPALALAPVVWGCALLGTLRIALHGSPRRTPIEPDDGRLEPILREKDEARHDLAA